MFTIYQSTIVNTNRTFIGYDNPANTVVPPVSYLADLCQYSLASLRKEILFTVETEEEAIYKVQELRRAFTTQQYSDSDIAMVEVRNISKTYDYKEKEFNILYATRNLTDDTVYVGSHTSESLKSYYIGSSRQFLAIVKEQGKKNFKRENIQLFEDIDEMKFYEQNVIRILLEREVSIYNKRAIGTGGDYGEEFREKVSVATKERWNNGREEMIENMFNDESRKKRSDGIKKWIDENPEEHKARMDKINKDPDKIAKTAETHRGMKRPDSTKKKLSESRKAVCEANKHDDAAMAAISGRGTIYVTDTRTWVARRVNSDYVLMDYEVHGVKKDPTKARTKKSPGKKVVTNTDTWEVKHVFGEYTLMTNEEWGNPKTVKRLIGYNRI